MTTTVGCPKCRQRTTDVEFARGRMQCRCKCGHRWSEPCTVAEFFAKLDLKKQKGDRDVRKSHG